MRDNHYLILGDHKDALFEDTTFTYLDKKIRGATLHGDIEKATATLMAGVVRGESATDEIPADGTSGPYYLENVPIVRGSERVEIQIRDRNNPNRIIRSNIQVRGRDYTIDYDDGEIDFRTPIEDSDFRGNPVYIVVTYQYESVEGLYNRSVWGARSTAAPTDSINLGATWLNEGPWNPGISDIWDERRQILGADLALKLSNRYKLGVEVAQSEMPEMQDKWQAEAIRINLDTNPIDALDVYGRYWRVEQNFLTFGNSNLAYSNVADDIETGDPFEFTSVNLNFDLDPNINETLGVDEESAGVSGNYHIGEFQTVSAGIRQTHDNVPDDTEEPTETTRNMFASYKLIHPEKTDLLLGAESISQYNDESPRTIDTQTDRLLGAVKHPLGKYRYAGDINLMGAYQYEDFDDNVDDDNSMITHDFIVRAESLPKNDIIIYAEQAEQFVYEKKQGRYIWRTDISAAGIDGRITKNTEIQASAKYRVLHDLVNDEINETEQIYTLHLTGKPADKIRAGFKAEYRNLEYNSFSPLRRIERIILGGQVNWDIRANLTAKVKYEYEIDKDSQGETQTRDDFMARLNYKIRDNFSIFGYYRIENDKFEEDPFSPTESRLTTILLGTKYQISDRFDLTAAYRVKDLDADIDDHRRKFFIETGYMLNRFLKLVVGYEHFEYSRDDTDEEDYKADIGYFSVIVKL